MQQQLFRLANRLFDHAYPVYRPLYSAWKAFADRRERDLIRSVVRPGAVVADVGANIGVYTRFLAGLAGPSGAVHAFEPEPDNFARLQANCRGLAGTTLRQAAVGDRTGSVRLYVSDELNVDHRTFDSGDGRRAVDVAMVSLDDHFAAGSRVDFVKIDVQGFELSVLRGARRVLADNPQARVLMEYWPYGLRKAGTHPADVVALLRDLGFDVRAVAGATLAPFDPASLDERDVGDYCNLFLARAGSPR